ncbi:MAG: hypothetical protein P857_183 [Candidatus Xenolissoclinum pacificiensis L6]|uniref:Uncharacterized protein n=1 Tax=Candidatus Xenolissoclinum pacificiensis L6 TaxID=1401685 RepID=W2V092_9RICK|nr:MAG: hypothetical protein P857_183 [Candidatus Xenolissoclinum pacificiensis L6]
MNNVSAINQVILDTLDTMLLQSGLVSAISDTELLRGTKSCVVVNTVQNEVLPVFLQCKWDVFCKIIIHGTDCYSKWANVTNNILDANFIDSLNNLSDSSLKFLSWYMVSNKLYYTERGIRSVIQFSLSTETNT